MRALISGDLRPARRFCGVFVLAVLTVLAGIHESAAEPCMFGSNRPAIDTMTRHLTSGATVIACDQKAIPMVRPAGEVRPMKTWSFGVVKEKERR